ncbi:MAG TPA: GIY-YIG nuclease family protein [Candidatus Saccharimonadales bacterium]
MLFCCYKITNLVNKKVYIGKTNRPHSRWIEHTTRAFKNNTNYPLHHAIRKYGRKNFVFEIIAISESEKQINICETLYIKMYKSNINVYDKSFGYNFTDGGDGISGWKHTYETRKKMSLSHTGLHPTEDTIKKMKRPHPNMIHTEEFKNSARLMFSGEKSNTAKLTWEIVNLIREDYKTGNFTQKQLSIKHNTSLSNVGSILRNESWRI